MIEDRIILLTTRKLACEATPEELDELNDYLLHHPEAIYYTDLLSQLWEDKSTTFNADTKPAYLRHTARHKLDFELEEVDSGEPVHTDNFRPQGGKSVFFRRYRLSIAAIFLLLIGTFVYFISFQSRNPSADHGEAELIAVNGIRKKVILPDGTQVWLNSGSKLSYDSMKYNKDSRMVCLSGEAFFDVTRNKDKPFIIHTRKISIKVLGTAFNVKAYPDEKLTETTLLRGSIEFTDNNKPYQRIMLKPNEKIVLIEEDLGKVPGNKHIPHLQQHTISDINKNKLVIQEIQPVLVADKEYVKEVSWVENKFVFQNESLAELIPKMERWFNVTIEINNDSLKMIHFTGIFHKETISEALYAMQLIKSFKYKINQDHVFIN